MEQILQNLRDGDVTTALMVAGVAVMLFLLLKFMTSIFKALLIMVVIVVAIAVFYPQAHIVDKVQQGTEVAIEKGKHLTEQVKKATGHEDSTWDRIKKSVSE